MKNFINGAVKIAAIGTIGAIVGAVIHGIGWVSGFGTGALMRDKVDQIENDKATKEAMEKAEDEIKETSEEIKEMLS